MRVTRLLSLVAAGFVGFSLTLAPVSARAQAGAAPLGAEKKVTLDLRDIPLRDALGLLFQGSGIQYAIDPNVPNIPITLNIRDIGLAAALRLIVRQAAVQVPGLTQAKEGEIYLIRIRQQTAAPPPVETEAPPDMSAGDQDLTWEKVPIQFNNVAVFVLAFGGTMLPTEQDVLLSSGGMGGGMGGYGGGMMGGGMGGFGGGMGGFGGGMMGGLGGGMMGGLGGGGFGGGLGGFGGGLGGGLGGFGGGLGGGLGGGVGGFGGGLGGGGFGGGGFGGGRRF